MDLFSEVAEQDQNDDTSVKAVSYINAARSRCGPSKVENIVSASGNVTQ